VRGLLMCSFPGCPERGASLRDRDINAPLNVERAFIALDMGGDVPLHMQRGSHKEADALDWVKPFTQRPPLPNDHSLDAADGFDVHLGRLRAREQKSWKPPWPDTSAPSTAQQRRLERRAAERAGRVGGLAADAVQPSAAAQQTRSLGGAGDGRPPGGATLRATAERAHTRA